MCTLAAILLILSHSNFPAHFIVLTMNLNLVKNKSLIDELHYKNCVFMSEKVFAKGINACIDQFVYSTDIKYHFCLFLVQWPDFWHLCP